MAVDSSWLVAFLTVNLLANMTSSRSILLDSGASSRLLFGWCWILDANPTLDISGHVGPEVTLSNVLSSILHLGRVSPGVELSVPVWVWPACLCSFTAFLDNVSAVSKCILSCLLGAMNLAPFLAVSMVDFFRLYFRCRLEVKLN